VEEGDKLRRLVYQSHLSLKLVLHSKRKDRLLIVHRISSMQTGSGRCERGHLPVIGTVVRLEKPERKPDSDSILVCGWCLV
jgi:hypothetical protein